MAMYQLGDIHLRLEAVTMVRHVHPLLGHEGVQGFDVVVGGHTYTAKFLDVVQARLAHARLLAALEDGAPEGVEPARVAAPARQAPAPPRTAPAKKARAAPVRRR